MSNEFYPLGLYYSNAFTYEADKRGFNGEGRGYGCQLIGGIYRMEGQPDALLEVALQYQPYPSFCGGAFAHSPQVRVWKSNGWRGILEMDSNVVNVESAEDIPEWMVTLPEPEDKDWISYGYRILANLMFSAMAQQGKRGVVLSGPIDHEVADFCEQAATMTTFRKALTMANTLPFKADVGQTPLPVMEGDVKVEVQETREWVNFNSSNECRYFPIVVTGPAWGGWDIDDGDRVRVDPWDQCEDAWYALSDEEQSDYDYDIDTFYDANQDQFISVEGFQSGKLTDEEKAYSLNIGAMARRYNWSN